MIIGDYEMKSQSPYSIEAMIGRLMEAIDNGATHIVIDDDNSNEQTIYAPESTPMKMLFANPATEEEIKTLGKKDSKEMDTYIAVDKGTEKIEEVLLKTVEGLKYDADTKVYTSIENETYKAVEITVERVMDDIQVYRLYKIDLNLWNKSVN